MFSANPASADYNPANFNRIVRALRAVGAPAPDEVPVASRKLKDRASGGSANKASSAPAGPASFGWKECPTCKAVVTDLAGHVEGLH